MALRGEAQKTLTQEFKIKVKTPKIKQNITQESMKIQVFLGFPVALWTPVVEILIVWSCGVWVRNGFYRSNLTYTGET